MKPSRWPIDFIIRKRWFELSNSHGLMAGRIATPRDFRQRSSLGARLAGHIVFPNPALRAPAKVLRENRQAQDGLWKFGAIR